MVLEVLGDYKNHGLNKKECMVRDEDGKLFTATLKPYHNNIKDGDIVLLKNWGSPFWVTYVNYEDQEVYGLYTDGSADGSNGAFISDVGEEFFQEVITGEVIGHVDSLSELKALSKFTSRTEWIYALIRDNVTNYKEHSDEY